MDGKIDQARNAHHILIVDWLLEQIELSELASRDRLPPEGTLSEAGVLVE